MGSGQLLTPRWLAQLPAEPSAGEGGRAHLEDISARATAERGSGKGEVPVCARGARRERERGCSPGHPVLFLLALFRALLPRFPASHTSPTTPADSPQPAPNHPPHQPSLQLPPPSSSPRTTLPQPSSSSLPLPPQAPSHPASPHPASPHPALQTFAAPTHRASVTGGLASPGGTLGLPENATPFSRPLEHLQASGSHPTPQSCQ